jgi:hypothetical protein
MATKPKFPIETATCREIMASVDPYHNLHTMEGATISKASVEMLCVECKEVVKMTAEDAEALGWQLGDVASRLKKLGQVGRKTE